MNSSLSMFRWNFARSCLLWTVTIFCNLLKIFLVALLLIRTSRHTVHAERKNGTLIALFHIRNSFWVHDRWTSRPFVLLLLNANQARISRADFPCQAVVISSTFLSKSASCVFPVSCMLHRNETVPVLLVIHRSRCPG